MKNAIGSFLAVVLLLLMAAPARAVDPTTTVFYGTNGDDEIIVGRGFIDSYWGYYACINDSWYFGGQVSPYGTDSLYVFGLDGDDYIYVQKSTGYVVCGAQAAYLYGLDQAYIWPNPCPYVYISGDDDNDAISGGACAETLVGANDNDTLWGGGGGDWLYGGCGSDCLSDDEPTLVSCGECGFDSDKEDTPISPSAGNCESSCLFCVYSP